MIEGDMRRCAPPPLGDQPLQEAAGRLGWSIVAIVCDEDASGARGRDRRTLSRLTTLTMPAVGVEIIRTVASWCIANAV
jgi:hypothetical protein